jgi:hypothetical protein
MPEFTNLVEHFYGRIRCHWVDLGSQKTMCAPKAATPGGRAPQNRAKRFRASRHCCQSRRRWSDCHLASVGLLGQGSLPSGKRHVAEAHYHALAVRFTMLNSRPDLPWTGSLHQAGTAKAHVDIAADDDVISTSMPCFSAPSWIGLGTSIWERDGVT